MHEYASDTIRKKNQILRLSENYGILFLKKCMCHALPIFINITG